MTPPRILRTTFSHTSTPAPTLVTSAVSRARPATFARALWQVTQQVSMRPRVTRSITCSASLWKLPALSNQVSPRKFLVPITNVSPSQRPRESPIQKGISS